MRNKFLITVFLFLIMLFIVVPSFLLLTLDSVSYNDQPPLKDTYNLFGERYVKQIVVPSYSFLNGIGLSIKNPNLKNKEEVKLEIYRDGKLIRTSYLSGFNIPDQ